MQAVVEAARIADSVARLVPAPQRRDSRTTVLARHRLCFRRSWGDRTSHIFGTVRGLWSRGDMAVGNAVVVCRAARTRFGTTSAVTVAITRTGSATVAYRFLLLFGTRACIAGRAVETTVNITVVGGIAVAALDKASSVTGLKVESTRITDDFTLGRTPP